MNEMILEESYQQLKNWWETIDLTNYEKSLLNKEIISFNQKLFRLKEKTLRVGVYGKAGVGKSSILNSILKEDFFQTGILNGSTKEILLKEYFLNSRKINKIELIDTPGFDVCNFQNQIKLLLFL